MTKRSSAFSEFKKQILEEGLESIGLYYGTYEAIVRSNEDPDKRGRIKVECPALYGSGVTYDEWVLPRGRAAGDKWGQYWQPSENDFVWITCRNGNPEFPVWEFGWWPREKNIENAHEKKFMFVTPTGHEITIDEQNDNPDNHTITIAYKNGKVIELQKQKINLGTANASAEKAAKGDTLKQTLSDLIDAVKTLNNSIQSGVIAVSGPVGTPNPLYIAALNANIATLNTIQGSLDQILSQVVTLD